MSHDKIVVAALYKFAPLANHESLQPSLRDVCARNGVRGILLLASEGINGTICGPREGINTVLAFIRGIPGLGSLTHKESYAQTMPFRRLKVRLKKEIVTLGIPEVDPTKTVGTYVQPSQWNDLIQDPEVLVLDTRNVYEVRVGTFHGAVNPQTQTFREFPDYVRQNLDPKKHKKVAMFCTGGIRCEKASSFMLQAGFETVYHLEGGILKYLEEIPPQKSLWHGECFVFDQRVSVTQNVAEGNLALCFGCRQPLTDEEKRSPHYKQGIHCPYCYSTATERHLKRVTDRHHQLQRQAISKNAAGNHSVCFRHNYGTKN